MTTTTQSTSSVSVSVSSSGDPIPIVSTHRKSKYHKLVTFTPRLSTFDRRNQLLHQNPLRGLYTLFWILLTFHILATLYASGSFTIQAPLARLFTRHLPQLVLVDLSMVASTLSALVFSQLIAKNYLRYSPTGQIIQHLFQFVWLGLWIAFIFSREWPWIQSGFLTLHSITMLMKIHSYCATNGEYAELYKILEVKIDQLIQLEVIQLSPMDKSCKQFKLSDLISSRVYKDLHQFLDQTTQIQTKENIYQKRQIQMQEYLSKTQDLPDKNLDGLIELKVQEAIDILHHLGITDHNSHQDDDDKNDEETKCWPQNLSISNFMDYLLVPTLVYELRYPRTKEIRYSVMIEKIFEVAGIFGLLYMITQYYIWDHVSSIKLTDQGALPNVIDNVIKLMIPFTINYLLIFYIIFEGICNAFAELTRFADREFYSDWWNSCSFDEFSRKWNKPVHHFLLKHVYASTISSYGFSRSAAAMITFFLSSLVHELLMVIVTRKLRLYLFLAQMTQLPLTYIGKFKFFRSRPWLANVLFWIGLLSGFPALAVCYILY